MSVELEKTPEIVVRSAKQKLTNPDAKDADEDFQHVLNDAEVPISMIVAAASPSADNNLKGTHSAQTGQLTYE